MSEGIEKKCTNIEKKSINKTHSYGTGNNSTGPAFISEVFIELRGARAYKDISR